RQQLREQRLGGIIGSNERIEFHAIDSRTATAAAIPAKTWTARQAECFIEVMRKYVETAFLLQVDIVVACPNPITVVVNEDVFQGEEFQRALDVQERLKGFLQFARRCLVQHLAKPNESGPGLRIVLALNLIDFLVS